MMVFSKELDLIVDKKIAKFSAYLSSFSDWVELTEEQENLFFKNPPPDGKKRKAGTIELEDIPPKPTDELFDEEMDALNAEYDKHMEILANKYSIAVARDGSQETPKVKSARAEISTLDAQYESDQLAILNKYYGA
jgi:hypothetical protein